MSTTPDFPQSGPASIPAAASFLGVSKRTIHRWIALGMIPTSRLSERIQRIDADWLRSNWQSLNGAARVKP